MPPMNPQWRQHTIVGQHFEAQPCLVITHLKPRSAPQSTEIAVFGVSPVQKGDIQSGWFLKQIQLQANLFPPPLQMNRHSPVAARRNKAAETNQERDMLSRSARTFSLRKNYSENCSKSFKY